LNTARETAVLDRGPFVGRSLELGELSRGLGRMLAGYGQLFLLEGEPGIGKTSLAENFALDAAATATRLLWAWCSDSPQAPALWPWLQLVHGYLHPDHSAKTRVQSQKRSALQGGPGTNEIAALDELLRLPSSAAQIDFHQFNSIATFLKDAARKRPLILVLDAFEAADNASLRILRFLAGQLRECRIMVVAAYRMGTFRLSASSGVSGELISHGSWVPLRGLSEAQVGTLVEKLVGSPPDDRSVAAIHEASGGNPLMVNHLVRLHLAERAGQSIARCVAVSSWNGLRLVTENHIAPLSAPTRELLEVAAAIGSEFDLTALKRASCRSSGEIFDALSEAESVGLVTDLEGMPERRYRFTHGLVRDALCRGHNAGLTDLGKPGEAQTLDETQWSRAHQRSEQTSPPRGGRVREARPKGALTAMLTVARRLPIASRARGKFTALRLMAAVAGTMVTPATAHHLNRRCRLSGRVSRAEIFSTEKASIGPCASGIHCSDCAIARVWY
jgi:predicted ATPase